MFKSILGIMSGSSLDGIDLALCSFNLNSDEKFTLLKTVEIELPRTLQSRLKASTQLPSSDLQELNVDYGKWIAKTILEHFNPALIDAIGLHGHTVFHQPQKGYTVQIGCPYHIATEINKPVISNFRNKDIALGGQGAPLVPVGDRDLFPQYNGWLNLGGIANITVLIDGNVKAWDVCPFNQTMNYVAAQMGQSMDKNGELAADGKINHALLQKLQQLPYFRQEPPKSLSNEWVRNTFIEVLDEHAIAPFDKLRTMVELGVEQVKGSIQRNNCTGVLVTGGGAHNSFFVQQLQVSGSGARLHVPEPEIVNFKEAIVFAYLGYLRISDKENVLSSVTGSKRNSVSGTFYTP